METLVEVLKVGLPAIIAGFFSFFVAKYTYNKNIPLEKLEIAYNRIYYPLYKLINDNNDIDLIIDKTKFYLNKYDKYVDKSTLKAFQSLCQCNSNKKRKDAYHNFKDNIYNRNSYLRRRLGYLEPGILQMSAYSSKAEKSTFRIILEFSAMYFCLILVGILKGEIQIFFVFIFLLILMISAIEIICKFVRFLYYKVRK